MKQLRCLLVDDEPLAIALLEKHISELDFLEVIGTCASAAKAIEILNTRSVDLMFLDIRMPSITGIELLRALRHPPRVIITTAYRDYAIEGYDLDIVDYLLKPITFDRFFKAVERSIRETNPGSVPDEEAILYVKSGYRHIKILIEDILYMESLKDYVKIVTLTGIVTTKYRISDMEAELPPGQFLRIHRSFIIHLKKLSAYSASQVEIGQTELPIGESYKELVLKTIRSVGIERH